MKKVRTNAGETMVVGAVPERVRISWAQHTATGLETLWIDFNAFYAAMLGNHLLRAAEDLRRGNVAKERDGA